MFYTPDRTIAAVRSDGAGTLGAATSGEVAITVVTPP